VISITEHESTETLQSNLQVEADYKHQYHIDKKKGKLLIALSRTGE
jgi:hypothetical protein